MRLERRGVLVVLGVMAGIAAVGLAARGEPGGGGGRSLTLEPGSGEAASTIAAYLFVALAVVVLAALVWGAVGGPRGDLPRRPRRSTLRSIVGLVLLLVVVTQLDRSRPPGDDVPSSAPTAPGAGEDGAVDDIDPASPAGSLAVAGLAVLVLAAALASVGRRRAENAGPDAAAVPGSAATPVVDHAAAVADERDPRRAVLLAFAAAEARLAPTPAARRPSTSPREWLAIVRALAPAAAPPLTDLVARYELARFSDHPVGEADRRAALDALEALP